MNNTNSIELQEAIEKYIKWKSTTIDSAIKIYLPRLNQLMAYLKPEMQLKEISIDEIVAFNTSLKYQGYSEASRALTMRIIKNFIGFWHGRRLIDVSPKEIIPPKVLTPEQPVVDQDDFKQMISVIDDRFIDGLQKKLALHLLWDTGMRVSEMVGLNIGNILHNPETGLRTAKIVTKKTDRYNLVCWGSATNELLNRYLAWRLGEDRNSDRLFVQIRLKTNNGLTTRTIERWVNAIAKNSLIGKPITPHSFRHGKAHHILDSGGTAIDVQTILRHKNFNSSLNYMRLNQKKYLERASRFVEKETVVTKQKPTEYLKELAQSNGFLYNKD